MIPHLRLTCPLTVAIAAVLGGPALAWSLPNSSETPGVVESTDVGAVCVRGYSRSIRPAYTAQWRRFRVSVFSAYGIPHDQWRRYTIDHLIPLELGGAPQDLRNVWPEPKTEAKEKDEVEDALLTSVCYRHTISLAAAQTVIAKNWTHTSVGLPRSRTYHYGE